MALQKHSPLNPDRRSKVLIIDDTPDNIQVLAGILSEKDVSLSYASSGQKALAAIHENLPDLILLDITMPGMDGFQVCKELKSHPQTLDIPVIFLTARVEEEDVLKGFRMGAVDYVTKPFNAQELVSRVYTHLELKHSKDLIREQNKKLEELNATKDKLFSIISHDLKNVFNNIMFGSDSLAKDIELFQGAQIKDIAVMINVSVKRAFALFDNLLEWARSQSGLLRFEPEPLYLEPLIDETILLFSQQISKKNIHIEKHFPPEQTFIYVDFQMIGTVLRNLISNAIKYTSDNGWIRVAIRNSESWCHVEVADNGIGIEKEDLDRLFRVDSQFSRPGTANETGTGIGLILCKEFIEKNKGAISVASTKGEGSTFSFYLPIYDENIDLNESID